MKSILVVLLMLSAARGQVPGEDLLQKILTANVRNGKVDYLVIRRDHWAELTTCLDQFASVDPAKLNENDRLAFYINLYNASMIRAVIQHLNHDWTPASSGFAVFKERDIRLLHQKISLDRLEHKIIRKSFKEPRVHVALVCGAVSCPPLLPRAYRGKDLNTVLHANMVRFVTDTTRNPIDVQKRKLRLSRIFEWFHDDFGGEAKIPAYVDSFHPGDLRKFELSFAPYSWKLNIAPPASGKWVRIKTYQGSAAPAGSILSVVSRKDGRITVRLPFTTGKTLELSAEDVRPYGK